VNVADTSIESGNVGQVVVFRDSVNAKLKARTYVHQEILGHGNSSYHGELAAKMRNASS